jgi:outer membrane receptor protein involved in Fe transport
VLQNASFSAYTGHAVLDWTPKLDFTDQTLVYASYSRGYRSGGFNPPATQPGLYPTSFAPETIDAYELGTKNVLLDASLQANLTAWYYNYQGYQISTIINRSSVNQNINSKLWGVEGEFFYAPTTNWQFNASFGYTNSNIQNTALLDTQDPTQGAAGYTLLKDANGANCAIYPTTGSGNPTASATNLPTYIAAPQAPLPTSIAAQSGYLIYNSSVAGTTCGNLATGVVTIPGYSYAAGVNKNLSGNQMPSTPPWTVSFGVQYTFNLDGGYTLVPRYDFYWNASSFITVFNDPADKVSSYDNMNAQLQLNAPDNLWYARLWIKNIQDKANVTGGWVSDPSSGLFTNEFVSDPRTYGITLGAHF